jgi:hypothetical protein
MADERWECFSLARFFNEAWNGEKGAAKKSRNLQADEVAVQNGKICVRLRTIGSME